MPKGNIDKALEELNKEDIYSLILFVLYKLKNVSEYSILSELVYILDNGSFSRFISKLRYLSLSDTTRIV